MYIYIDENINYLLFWSGIPQRDLTSSFIHSLSSLNRKATLERKFSCLGLQQSSVATVDVSHFVSILMWVNNSYHLFGKIYIDDFGGRWSRFRHQNSRKFDSRGAVEKIFFDTIFFEESWVSSRKIRLRTTFMFINKHLVTYAKWDQ